MPVTRTSTRGTPSRPRTCAGTGTRPAGGRATAAADGPVPRLAPSVRGVRWTGPSTRLGEDDHVVLVTAALPVEGPAAGDQPEFGARRRCVDLGRREGALG